MVFVKRVASLLAKVLLQAELLAWIIFATLVLLMGSATPVKRALETANVYQRLPDVVLKQSVASNGDGQVPLADATVQKLVKDTFTEQKLESYSNIFLDGMFRWLNGEVTQPDFNIDLSVERQTIAEGVAARAANRLAGLPPCTRVPAGSLDPFTIECLPPGIDISLEKERLKNEILANQGFLPTTITAEQLPKNAEGATFTESSKEVPGRYQLMKRLPLVVSLLGLATAVAIILLDKNKRRGIRMVGRMILANGSFVLFITLLFGLALPGLSDSLRPRYISGDAAPLMNDLILAIIKTLNKVLLISSGTLVVIGGLILLGERFINPEQSPQTDLDETLETSEPETKQA